MAAASQGKAGRLGGEGRRRVGAVEIARDRAWICVPKLREGCGAFRLFVKGDTLYGAMIEAIEGAEYGINLESFIFAADDVGRRRGWDERGVKLLARISHTE